MGAILSVFDANFQDSVNEEDPSISLGALRNFSFSAAIFEPT
jgi:hypothetical protein